MDHRRSLSCRDKGEEQEPDRCVVWPRYGPGIWDAESLIRGPRWSSRVWGSVGATAGGTGFSGS
uniref:U1620n n=1 Tax=Mycobacterium leprae TaxID=1769 RepID=Q49732_MYCLR|nr:u1620n [Mycobacterium leprae]